MDFIELTDSKLSLDEISDLTSSPSCGAVSFFVGTTRDNFDNQKVVQLQYEAYKPMAEKAAKKICKDIRNKWKVENIAIYHRLGIVPVKEASVVVAVSSVHRAESLDAVHYAIDTLKASVPIWKKEVYEDDKAEWKENKECSWTIQSKEEEGCHQESQNSSEELDSKSVTVVGDSIPHHMIQIKAGPEEVKRRIEAFIERKREEINVGNIQDFCYNGTVSSEESSCARVDAVVIQRKDSKSHLRVRRVLNPWGPQTRGLDPGSMMGTHPPDPAVAVQIKPDPDREEFHPGLEERLCNVEQHLELRRNAPVPKDIYSRLKRLEEKILFLEGLSPEYFQFWCTAPARISSQRRVNRPVHKRTYTVAQLDSKLEMLQKKLTEKRPATEQL